jgi:hypothetical protein
MKIAYGIMVHEKPYQFEWLYRAIHCAQDLFAIHVDLACPDDLFNAFLNVAPAGGNTFYIPRQKAVWGGWEIVGIELALIQALLQKDPTWSHFVNLSGTCYPLQPRAGLVSALARAPQMNHIELGKVSDENAYVQQRVSLVHQNIDGFFRRTSIPKSPSPSFDIEWVGSNWHILTRPFCEWITSDPLARHIVEHMMDIGIPDEHVVQCLVMNSPFARTVGPLSREMVWLPEAYHPATLLSEHEQRLLQSTKLFARKFDAAVDADILTTLARRIRAPVPASAAQREQGSAGG